MILEPAEVALMDDQSVRNEKMQEKYLHNCIQDGRSNVHNVYEDHTPSFEV